MSEISEKRGTTGGSTERSNLRVSSIYFILQNTFEIINFIS